MTMPQAVLLAWRGSKVLRERAPQARDSRLTRSCRSLSLGSNLCTIRQKTNGSLIDGGFLTELLIHPRERSPYHPRLCLGLAIGSRRVYSAPQRVAQSWTARITRSNLIMM